MYSVCFNSSSHCMFQGSCRSSICAMKTSFPISVCGTLHSTLSLFQNQVFLRQVFFVWGFFFLSCIVTFVLRLTWGFFLEGCSASRMWTHMQSRMYTYVCIEVSNDFWKLKVRHLQNGLYLQSWGLQLVTWLSKTFHVLFQNWDTQNL